MFDIDPRKIVRTQFTYRERDIENPYPREITCCVCKFITYGPPAVASDTIMMFSHLMEEHIVEEDGRCFIIPDKHKKCRDMFALSPFSYSDDQEISR